MWTLKYKGAYIHGYCDRDECSVGGRKCKSLRAAKNYVSRYLAQYIPGSGWLDLGA